MGYIGIQCGVFLIFISNMELNLPFNPVPGRLGTTTGKDVALNSPKQEPPVEFDVRLNVPYLLGRAANGLLGRLTEVLKQQDLSLGMWRILALLYAQSPLRFSALFTLSSMEPSTASRFINELLQRGLIAKKKSKTDARGVLLSITRAGQQTVRSLLPQVAVMEKDTLAGFSEDEVYLARRLLQRMCDNVSPLIEYPE
ncbi:MAG TPA: MarR family transcriptional regulator [Beijerinckiaceae bacterium]|jgi:DNA-binding MarR family transcriptional regulator|nr:MarR family transcriptional regulator [Beijerinckiaceae bacterium]